MAIEVRIPTILRPYTDGAKVVEATGDSLGAVIDDLETRHLGLRERIVDDAGLKRFVNLYINDEDVRFLGGLDAPVSDGSHCAHLIEVRIGLVRVKVRIG